MPTVQFARPKQLWSMSALADECGIDRRTAKARMEGVEPDGKLPTGHPAWRAVTAIPHLLKIPVPTGEDFDPAELAPQDRLAYWRSENERLKVAVERGELVSRLEVEREFARFFEQVGRFYDTLPDMLERRGLMTAEILSELEALLDKHREELYRAVTEEGEASADNAAG